MKEQDRNLEYFDDLDKLESLKQEYNNIPVPEAAKARIMSGIQKGKTMNKKHNPFFRILRTTGTTAAAAVVALAIVTNVSPTIANAMTNLPVIGAIAKVVTLRTYEDKTNHFEAKVDIPEIDSAPEAVNRSIEDYANELIAQYEKDLRASQGEGNYSLTSTYKVVTDTDRYLCLRIDTTLVMASGTEYTKVFTIDKTTGDIISLSDLFKNKPEMLTAISDNIKEQMKQQMAADSSVTYFIDSDMPEWDFKELKGDESFYFNEKGELVDGDQIMAICGTYMKQKGTLKKNTIVVTVMTNLGFSLMGEREGIHVEKTKVGDRYVLENMREHGYNIGGEQSGHVIFLDDNTTGDGLLSALHLLEVMVKTKKTLSELASVMEVLPQALVNAKVPNHKKDNFMDYQEIADAVAKLEQKFNGEGRVLIRPSGTEPLVRVMIEGKDQKVIDEEAKKLEELITKIML